MIQDGCCQTMFGGSRAPEAHSNWLQVLSSAKQHLSAVERLKRATAAHLAAEARVDEISEGQKGQLHSEVEDARRRQARKTTPEN
jgi:hypothetical protein